MRLSLPLGPNDLHEPLYHGLGFLYITFFTRRWLRKFERFSIEEMRQSKSSDGVELLLISQEEMDPAVQRAMFEMYAKIQKGIPVFPDDIDVET